jgi:FAD/FMN-containing dehydrogenase
VRAGAGVIWQEVVDAAAEHGLAALHGSAHDVGVVGYSLGGGIGWYARRYGMSANSVLAVELVTADGSIVRADANHEPELFWAVRGGGGSFGVVTAVEIALLPITEVYAGVLFWPVERAPEVLKAYAAWAETVPDEVTSAGRIMQFPPFPGIPEPLRGNTFALVEVAALLDEVEGAALLAPLRELGPAMDTMTLMPAQALTSLHMDPPSPVPGAGDGTTIRELTDETVDALVAVAGAGSGSPLLSVELRQLGGALARRAPGNGAAASVDGAYAVFAVGMAPTPEAEAETRHHVERVLGALEPWKAERTYFNFTERSVDSGELHAAETLARLRAVKADIDPEGVFQANHEL